MRYARNGDRQTASAVNGSKVDSERGSPNHLQRVVGTSYNAPVKEKFNRYKFSQLSLVVENFGQEDELIRELGKHADPNTLVQVRLSGL